MSPHHAALLPLPHAALGGLPRRVLQPGQPQAQRGQRGAGRKFIRYFLILAILDGRPNIDVIRIEANSFPKIILHQPGEKIGISAWAFHKLAYSIGLQCSLRKYGLAFIAVRGGFLKAIKRPNLEVIRYEQGRAKNKLFLVILRSFVHVTASQVISDESHS